MCVKVKMKAPPSRLTLCHPWTVACQAPLSKGFSKPEYWSGQLFPSPEDLPDVGNDSGSPALQADCLPPELPGVMVGLGIYTGVMFMEVIHTGVMYMEVKMHWTNSQCYLKAK